MKCPFLREREDLFLRMSDFLFSLSLLNPDCHVHSSFSFKLLSSYSLFVSESFIYRWKKNGEIDPLPNPGRGSTQRLNPMIEKKLCEIVDGDSEQTSHTIQFELDQMFESDPTYSSSATSTIVKVLHRQGLKRIENQRFLEN